MSANSFTTIKTTVDLIQKMSQANIWQISFLHKSIKCSGLLKSSTLNFFVVFSIHFLKFYSSIGKRFSGLDLSHVMGNHALRFFSCHTQRQIGGWSPPIFLLVWHQRTILCCPHILYSVGSVIPKEGLARPRPPILLLVWQRQIS